MVKYQVVTAEVSTNFSKCPLLKACNFGRSSFQTHVIPFLVLFLHFLTIFLLTSHLFLGATTKGWKESIGFPGSKLHAESFEEKIH